MQSPGAFRKSGEPGLNLTARQVRNRAKDLEERYSRFQSPGVDGPHSGPVNAPCLYGFLVLSLLITIFLLQIKIEEDMLTEHFGDEYRAYRKTAKKLIPFFY
jgi:hypothetical protein